MKKQILTLTALTLCTLSLAGCQQSGGNTVRIPKDGSQNNQMAATAPSNNTQPAGNSIDENTAKETALSHAGITEADTLNLRVHFDRDDGRDIYDVEFYTQDKEYDYEIDAYTGDILSWDEEIEHDFLNQQPPANNTTNPPANNTTNPPANSSNSASNSSIISLEEATRIALEQVPGATAQDIYIHLDHDDGYQLYEGDIWYDGMEYEFEINAQTGAILEWSKERKGF